jgi:hypothetical protein
MSDIQHQHQQQIENAQDVIDRVLDEMKHEYTRFKSNSQGELDVWDIPVLRARVAQSCLGGFVVRLCSEDFIVGDPLDVARILVNWNKDLRDAGKLQAQPLGS